MISVPINNLLEINCDIARNVVNLLFKPKMRWKITIKTMYKCIVYIVLNVIFHLILGLKKRFTKYLKISQLISNKLLIRTGIIKRFHLSNLKNVYKICQVEYWAFNVHLHRALVRPSCPCDLECKLSDLNQWTLMLSRMRSKNFGSPYQQIDVSFLIHSYCHRLASLHHRQKRLHLEILNWNQ